MVEKFILNWESLISNQGLSARIASQIHQALDWGHCQADEINILNRVLSFIDDVPQCNTTLVHLAALGEVEMMEALEEEPWAINQPDRYGMAPIHYASMDGDLEILKMLIWAEADVNISDLDGLTPLMFAALNGHVDCIRLLVDHKCNIEQRSHTEFRAIHYAAQFASRDQSLHWLQQALQPQLVAGLDKHLYTDWPVPKWVPVSKPSKKQYHPSW
ncbi:unnamed protein product [Clonostachys solani]|uniref:Uncharacterized protein n=1 Tax=Clonostachys solani TaxID=160281 RepID=A0A9P0ETM4_9HYPO|nr:unnamed protein product [Clonostachys solani]